MLCLLYAELTYILLITTMPLPLLSVLNSNCGKYNAEMKTVIYAEDVKIKASCCSWITE